MLYNAGILTKVYFPRLVMLISGLLSPLVDFFIAFVILILMMAYYGFVPTIAIVLLPFFILLALATSLVIGLWLSALTSSTGISSTLFGLSTSSGSMHRRLSIPVR